MDEYLFFYSSVRALGLFACLKSDGAIAMSRLPGTTTTSMPREDGGIQLSAFPKDTTSELSVFFLHTIPFALSITQGSCEYHFLKSFGMTR